MDNTAPDYVNQTAATKKSKLPIIIIAVVLLVVLAGGFFIFSHKGKPSEKPQVAAATTVAPTPSPTPTPTINKQSVKIQVLNGTGTPGQAAKVAVTLKNAGYNMDNIKTGNADNNVPNSTIAAKAGFESTAGDIKTVLSSEYPDITVDTSLSSDSAFDIIITIGGAKYVPPTSTPTPTPTTTAIPTPTPKP